jgi:hypothetical protein
MNGVAMKNTKAQSTKQSAAGCYAERYAEAKRLLERIGQQLQQHRRAAAPDWTDAGVLAHVNDKLAYVLADLGDESAIGERGLGELT